MKPHAELSARNGSLREMRSAKRNGRPSNLNILISTSSAKSNSVLDAESFGGPSSIEWTAQEVLDRSPLDG